MRKFIEKNLKVLCRILQIFIWALFATTVYFGITCMAHMLSTAGDNILNIILASSIIYVLFTYVINTVFSVHFKLERYINQSVLVQEERESSDLGGE